MPVKQGAFPPLLACASGHCPSISPICKKRAHRGRTSPSPPPVLPAGFLPPFLEVTAWSGPSQHRGAQAGEGHTKEIRGEREPRAGGQESFVEGEEAGGGRRRGMGGEERNLSRS